MKGLGCSSRGLAVGVEDSRGLLPVVEVSGLKGEVVEELGKYGCRLYVLVRRYLSKGEFTLGYEEIRRILLLDFESGGEEVHKYKNYYDFKVHVLNRFLVAMRTKLGCNIEVEEIRRSRQVVYLKFTYKLL